MKLFVATIAFVFAIPALAASAPTPKPLVRSEMKPESYDPWKIIGNQKQLKMARTTFSRATEEQFHVALEAARAELRKEGARQTHEANEDGSHWRVMDYNPANGDENEFYQVIEMENAHPERKLTKFVVRSQLAAFAPNNDWAWTAKKYVRYLVYVSDDNKVLAIKEENFASVIDFYEWKLENDAAREKKEKAMKPAGYSTELHESKEEAASSTSAE